MSNKNKQFPIIGDYVPVLQMMLENYHKANFKTQKMAMTLMADIGKYMNIQRDKDMESDDNN
jgi:hypothetical protein